MKSISILLNNEHGFPVLSMKIESHDSRVELSSIDFMAALDLIKSMDGRRYESETKTWKAPASEYNIDILEKSGYINSIETITSIRETLKKLNEERNRVNIEKSNELKGKVWFPGIPKDYQVEGFIKCITAPKGYGLTFDLGMGKTWTALSFLLLMKKENPGARFLIVVNKNGINTWLRESRLYGLDFINYGNVKDDKRADFWQSYNYVVCSYDQLRYIPDINKKEFKAKFDYIVFDESHCIKEFKSQRTEICMRLARESRKNLILTGTLYGNAAYDVFTQLYCIDQSSPFGLNYYGFLKTWFRKEGGFDMQVNGKTINTGKWMLKPEKKERFKEIVNSYTMRVVKDENNFPPKQHMVIDIQNDNKELKESYHLALRSLITDDGGDYVRLKQKMIKLQQICGGGYYYDDDSGNRKVKMFSENRKLEALLETVDSIINSDGKVLIWTNFVFEVEMIEKALLSQGYENIMKITGETSQKERKEIETNFQQDENFEIIICNIQAASESITLTAAKYAIYYSLTFSALKYWQSLGRIHRIGSDRSQPVIYYYLLHENLIDRHIYDVLNSKQALSDDLQNQSQSENEVLKAALEKIKNEVKN